jgi:hypothetical protein
VSRGLAVVAAVLALCSACEPLPEPFPRIVTAVPTGVVAAREPRIEFSASEPFSPDDVLGGRRIALCTAENLREVKRLAEAGEPLPAERIVGTRVELEDAGRRVVLVAEAPLVPGSAYAAVLANGVRAADGRAVLDPEGRPRSVVIEFSVSADVVGTVHAELTKILADADAPEAGGEYAEVANLATDPLDLAGFRLAKRGPSGAFTRCSITRRSGAAIAPGARGLIVGGAYDGRYALAPEVVVYECGASAVAGGLANDRAPALLLEAPNGATVSSIGVSCAAPRCDGGALVRVDAAGADDLRNLACSDLLAPHAEGEAAPRPGSPAP